MKKERILYITLGILFITYVMVEYYSPKPINWTITYSDKDKNPYGGFILYEQLNDFYTHKHINYLTLSELADSTGNIIILTDNFRPSPTDIEALFKLLNLGNGILIGAQIFDPAFMDTLGITFKYKPFSSKSLDSTGIEYNDTQISVNKLFATSYFEKDSIEGWDVHAEERGPVLISREFGAGNLILSSTPLIFTNYSLLKDDYRGLAEEALRLLPAEKVIYNQYYMAGKPEPKTPLRFLLSHDSLRVAAYLAAITLLIFLVVQSRRLQAAIPLKEKNINTTVQFIKTIGGLHHQKGNHKSAATKIISRFLKELANKYYILSYDERGYQMLSAKANVPVEDVIKSFELINLIKKSDKISEDTLKELYKKINLFKLS